MGCTRRRSRSVWFPLLLATHIGAAAPGTAQTTLPAGAIAFVHEDSGSTDPLRQIFNLRLLDTQDPARQVVLTAFGTAPTLVENPAWSRDFTTVAFASNVGNGLRSLEEESVYAIDVDGTDLRPLTGFGLLADLPGPTGVVTGRVVAQTLRIGARAVSPTVSGCVVSAQGASVTAACENDGSFHLTGVPVGAVWLRAQASVEYFDAVLGLYGGPGLSFGFVSIDVVAGRTTSAGDVTIAPAIEKSIHPSFAPDDRRLVASDRVRAMVLRQNPDTYAWEWVPTRGGTCVARPIGGLDGARCAIARLGTASSCDPGAVRRALRRFLDAQVTRAQRALDGAVATDRSKRRARLMRAADRRLAAIERRATKLAQAKRDPLDPVCRDRILADVTAARGVVAGLGDMRESR